MWGRRRQTGLWPFKKTEWSLITMIKETIFLIEITVLV